MPLPIVSATCVPKTKTATKLKNAAQTTALPGDSTRVETTVAIELAASWKPLMKSNGERDDDDEDDEGGGGGHRWNGPAQAFLTMTLPTMCV